MKKLFTLAALVCVTVGAANAQSKTTNSRSTVNTEKSALKSATPQQLSEEKVKNIEQRAINANRAGQFQTEAEVKARLEEKRKNSPGTERRTDDK